MPSKDYGRALRQMRVFHATSKAFSGNGVLKHRDAVAAFAEEIGATSVLDYGCGKGNQYDHERTGGYDFVRHMAGNTRSITVRKYDPGVPGVDVAPDENEEFDLVLCVDVLECVPEEDMHWMIGQLSQHARKGLFVAVAAHPSKKKLPDGRNAHLTQKPGEWWHAQFAVLTEARPELKLILLVSE